MIKLSREERKSLELLTRRGTAEQRQVTRAQIALMAHRGETTTAIAQALGVSVQTVRIGVVDSPSVVSKACKRSLVRGDPGPQGLGRAVGRREDRDPGHRA